MDHLAGMAAFARVVEAGSFSAAARSIGQSKSAVSKQIGHLEDRLGALLLHRTTRRIALTEVGRIYYEHCARMLAEAEEAERAVTALGAAPRGLLKVAAPMSFGVSHIAPALPDFLARCPELRVELSLSDRFVDLLEEGFDMAVRIARLPDSSLVARKLAPIRILVCAAPDYFARHGTPRRPEELSRHNCFGYTYLADPGRWQFAGPEGPLGVPVSGNLCANNGDALRAAALSGMGILRSPSFIVGPDLQAGRLVAVLQEWMADELTAYAVYPHRRHLTPKVRAFVDYLAERFGPEPYWDRDCSARHAAMV